MHRLFTRIIQICGCEVVDSMWITLNGLVVVSFPKKRDIAIEWSIL